MGRTEDSSASTRFTHAEDWSEITLMNAKKGQDAPQDFESGMTRLETIVERFDEGDLPLDEMEKLFTEGMDLVKRCGKRLEAVEARLKTAEEMKDDARQEDS